MKLKLLALVMGTVGTTAMTACSKCKVCTKENEAEVRLCEKDYDSQTEYGFAVDVMEADGYNCKESF